MFQTIVIFFLSLWVVQFLFVALVKAKIEPPLHMKRINFLSPFDVIPLAFIWPIIAWEIHSGNVKMAKK